MEEKPTMPGQAVLTVVALALIDAAGLVLMQRRPVHRAHGGLWEFPGGKVEPGEGTRAALIREIDEELGLSLTADHLVPVGFAAREGGDGEQPLILLLYACRIWQGTAVCEPGAELLWASLDGLAALAMPPLDVPLVAALHAHLGTAAKKPA
jgi:8-oxo-dGTP diphosphatase